MLRRTFLNNILSLPFISLLGWPIFTPVLSVPILGVDAAFQRLIDSSGKGMAAFDALRDIELQYIENLGLPSLTREQRRHAFNCAIMNEEIVNA